MRPVLGALPPEGRPHINPLSLPRERGQGGEGRRSAPRAEEAAGGIGAEGAVLAVAGQLALPVVEQRFAFAFFSFGGQLAEQTGGFGEAAVFGEGHGQGLGVLAGGFGLDDGERELEGAGGIAVGGLGGDGQEAGQQMAQLEGVGQGGDAFLEGLAGVAEAAEQDQGGGFAVTGLGVLGVLAAGRRVELGGFGVGAAGEQRGRRD